MKKIIVSCVLCSLVAFTFAGCGGVNISFGSDDKTAQEEVKQEQSPENKSVSTADKSSEGVKQDQNTGDNPTVNVNINEVPQTPSKQDVVVIREPSQIHVYSGSFVFPSSDRVYLTPSQVSSLTNYELGIARNEIYARHGYIFSTPKYIKYFNSQSWYTPISKNVTLNRIEEYNVSLIKAEEDRRGVVN